MFLLVDACIISSVDIYVLSCHSLFEQVWPFGRSICMESTL